MPAVRSANCRRVSFFPSRIHSRTARTGSTTRCARWRSFISRVMEAVKAGTSYDLIDPGTGKSTGQLDARSVWNKMIDDAWRTGEPGCFFIDEANRFNPVPHVGSYEATNPCGEQPLLPYDVCNLGSINVGYYVKNGVMDWSALKRDILLSTHFLDNIIDVNKYPLP